MHRATLTRVCRTPVVAQRGKLQCGLAVALRLTVLRAARACLGSVRGCEWRTG